MSAAKRPCPAGTPGNLENPSNLQQDFTAFLRTAQQVYPCASCAYLRLVPLPAGGVRKVCIFTGNRLGKAGKPACEFIKTGEA